MKIVEIEEVHGLKPAGILWVRNRCNWLLYAYYFRGAK